MAAQTWIEVHRGTLVVMKRVPPGEPEPVRSGGSAQVRWLERAADHPVVRPVIGASKADPDGTGFLLVTGFAGSPTALTGCRPPVETAYLLSAVARALGALHRDRLVHGNVTGDHIVIDGPRFALCSPSGSAGDPSSDVAAFGPLVELLVRRWEQADGAVPEVLAAWRRVGLVAAEAAVGADRLASRLEALTRPRPRFGRLRLPGRG